MKGWKNERIVADFHNNGRIIQIIPGDSKIWWRKMKDLMDVINRELGCFELEFSLDQCQASIIYMYLHIYLEFSNVIDLLFNDTVLI